MDKLHKIEIQINGESQWLPQDWSLQDLVSELKINPQQVAIAKNLEVIVRSQLKTTFLKPGDQIEIFHAVGGG